MSMSSCPLRITKMTKVEWQSKPVKGLLIDISGVLKTGIEAIPGSVEGLRLLYESGIPFRIVTNESQCNVSQLLRMLQRMGFHLKADDIFSPIPAVVELLRKENLRPHLIVNPSVESEFDEFKTEEEPNCVVMADAQEHFNYDSLNKVFRLLIDMEKPQIFTLGTGKYYEGDDGLLHLDVGPFTKAMEYATGLKARIVGKPSSDFFLSALDDLGIKPEEAVMIGDDVVSDVGGAQNSGMRGILVRTGKYRTKDEQHVIKPDAIFNNFNDAIHAILNI
ncbi:phospholysine phosphohistidine inorganic pyrophosphate phosphatase isoform X1 [Nilaparvata lugens]|uniref:phospholysine phosphohistidine inorganic pyrophosphate phosphatase isoform X1 n=1 Tax=Nilaparvata lugens TaxID=108931 RepID=UPI00193CE269|nr:phospholysine phosphohistidine inorganic pyrophosphate phosphatase isoform X1 [Nilaparvata lugens]